MKNKEYQLIYRDCLSYTEALPYRNKKEYRIYTDNYYGLTYSVYKLYSFDEIQVLKLEREKDDLTINQREINDMSDKLGKLLIERYKIRLRVWKYQKRIEEKTNNERKTRNIA